MTSRMVNVVGMHGDFILSLCPSNRNDHETTCAASPSHTHCFFFFFFFSVFEEIGAILFAGFNECMWFRLSVS